MDDEIEVKVRSCSVTGKKVLSDSQRSKVMPDLAVQAFQGLLLDLGHVSHF